LNLIGKGLQGRLGWYTRCVYNLINDDF